MQSKKSAKNERKEVAHSFTRTHNPRHALASFASQPVTCLQKTCPLFFRFPRERRVLEQTCTACSFLLSSRISSLYYIFTPLIVNLMDLYFDVLRMTRVVVRETLSHAPLAPDFDAAIEETNIHRPTLHRPSVFPSFTPSHLKWMSL